MLHLFRHESRFDSTHSRSLCGTWEKTKPQGTTDTQNPAKPIQQPSKETSPSVVVVHQNTAQGEKYEHPDKPPSYFHELLLPQNLPNIALVIVAAVTAAFIAWQAREAGRATQAAIQSATSANENAESSRQQTDRMIAIMRENAVQELRAYVCVSAAVIEFRQERAPEIRVYVKNFGKTPAYDVRWWHYITVTEWPSKRPLQDPPPNIVLASSLMAPRGKPHALVSKVPKPIPEEIMLKLGTMEYTLYAYGKVTYRDAFGVNRYTRYKLMYGGHEPPVNRDKNGIKVALLKPDYDGNDAD